MRKRVLILVLTILTILGTVAVTLAYNPMPASEKIAERINTIDKYSFTEIIQSNQYFGKIKEVNGSKEAIMKFAYKSSGKRWGWIDLKTMSAEVFEEYYINGTLVMRTHAKVENGKLSGYVELKDGKKLPLTQVLEENYGIPPEKAVEMFMHNHPLAALNFKLRHSTLIPVEPSPKDKLLMILGLKEKVYMYKLPSEENREWRVIVKGDGTPEKIELISNDPTAPGVVKAIIEINPIN
ncbi:hypothetical protein [Thermococcus barophilus]|uniref:Uncharacterized protein n=1 Tax=Thermococcus barophilus TaxID=55802 RepID=A0A0S1XBV0_THEBA|nr:hypothetical protein [Thermococcus barophilus]ALM75247.1 conserved exported hypothetical protein [Thermococcus barophilus]